MSRSVMRILGLVSGQPTPFDGQYLVHYDPYCPGVSPDGTPMTATVETTPDPSQARFFDSGAEALDYWRRDNGEVRPDGRPDRPLTAFHVEVSDYTG